jgi:hypothetical protein
MFELDEVYTVTLSNASGASISDGTGTGTINNDDNEPEWNWDIGLSTVSGTEGGTYGFIFVRISGTSYLTATVDWTLTS